MKYGVVVVRNTWNIGDDIQSYAAAQLLHQVDYYIEREHLDIFRPNEQEPVNTIVNGWLMNNKLAWPISTCINPLYISMHFHKEDNLRVYGDFLDDLGGKDLKEHEPIGCRDLETKQLLEEHGIKTWFSGCMTLTLSAKFPKTIEKPYVCLTDISPEAVAYVKEKYPGLEIRVIEHEPNELPPLVDQQATWESRFHQVEELLTVYQNAQAVVTTRLHCAMPCLALNTPVLLLNDHSVIENGRFDGLKQLVNCATTEEFISGKTAFSLETPPRNPDTYLAMREKLLATVADFLEKNKVCTPELAERFAQYDAQWEQRALWKNHQIEQIAQKNCKYWAQMHNVLDQYENGRKWMEGQIASQAARIGELEQWTAELDKSKQCQEQQITAKNARIAELEQWATELENAKQYQEQQIAAKDARIAELEQWAADLESAKQYQEQQVVAKVARIAELEQWTAELENAKQYQEQQITTKDARIAELEQWTAELESGKTHLENQWKSEKYAHEETKKTVQELNEQDAQSQNTIAKQKYMLRLLMSDKWIQRIVKYKKIKLDY